MDSTFFVYVLALLAVGGCIFLLASVAFGRGEELAPPPREQPPLQWPADRPVNGTDVRYVRVPVVLRGYRMTDVDWILDRLAQQLDERDQEIAELRHELATVPSAIVGHDEGRKESPSEDDIQDSS